MSKEEIRGALRGFAFLCFFVGVFVALIAVLVSYISWNDTLTVMNWAFYFEAAAALLFVVEMVVAKQNMEEVFEKFRCAARDEVQVFAADVAGEIIRRPELIRHMKMAASDPASFFAVNCLLDWLRPVVEIINYLRTHDNRPMAAYLKQWLVDYLAQAHQRDGKPLPPATIQAWLALRHEIFDWLDGADPSKLEILSAYFTLDAQVAAEVVEEARFELGLPRAK